MRNEVIKGYLTNIEHFKVRMQNPLARQAEEI